MKICLHVKTENLISLKKIDCMKINIKRHFYLSRKFYRAKIEGMDKCYDFQKGDSSGEELMSLEIMNLKFDLQYEKLKIGC